MKNYHFKSTSPLEECRQDSDLGELFDKDEEYTKKAQKEGKPYYKWDTNKDKINIVR